VRRLLLGPYAQHTPLGPALDSVGLGATTGLGIGREGGGWVNWPGLATLLSEVGIAVADALERTTLGINVGGSRPGADLRIAEPY